MKKNETGAQSKKYVRSLATYLLLDIALNISQLEMYIHIQYTVYTYTIYNIQCIHVQHTFDYKVNKRFQHGLRHQCCLDYRCNPKSGFDNVEHADIPAAIDLSCTMFVL